MSRGERDAWPLARQAVFGFALAMLAAVLLFGLDGEEAPGRRASGVIEASAAPVVTLSRTVPAVPDTPVPAAHEVAAPAPEPTVTGTAPAPTPAAEPSVALDAGADPSPTTTAAPSVGTTSTTAVFGDASVTTGPPTTALPITAPSTTTTTVAAALPPAPAGPVRTPSIEAEIVPLTNRDRSAQGLGALSRDGCLDGVASGYAREMARTSVLAHNPDAGNGVAGCRPGATWGDNVGTAAPCSAALLEERWMASPSHRRNILTGAFRYMGIGAWTDTAGSCWVQVLFSS